MNDNRTVTVFVWHDGFIISTYDVSGKTTGESIIAVKEIIEREGDFGFPIDQYSYSYEEQPL